jgi:hypothetical protein
MNKQGTKRRALFALDTPCFVSPGKPEEDGKMNIGYGNYKRINDKGWVVRYFRSWDLSVWKKVKKVVVVVDGKYEVWVVGKLSKSERCKIKELWINLGCKMV